jgi:hypothetical protein
MPHLQVLELQHNRIASLSPQLGALRKLETLRLDDNQLASLHNLPASLRSLDVSANQLGSLQGIEGLVRLQELMASHNMLSSLAPVGRCVHLTELNLSHNKLSALGELAKCTALVELDVSHNAIDSLLPLKALTNLRVLRAGHNRLSECANLPVLAALVELYLPNNTFPQFVLAKTPALEVLNLRDNQLTPAAVDSLLVAAAATHPQLTAIEVGGNATTSTSLTARPGSATAAAIGARPATAASTRPATAVSGSSHGGGGVMPRPGTAAQRGVPAAAAVDLERSLAAMQETEAAMRRQFADIEARLAGLSVEKPAS